MKFDEIHSLPAATERTALRAQLEGLNLGCHSFVTDVGGFAQLASQAAGTGQRLLGFSDGSVSDDGNLGSYGWLVAVLTPEGRLRALAASQSRSKRQVGSGPSASARYHETSAIQSEGYQGR